MPTKSRQPRSAALAAAVASLLLIPALVVAQPAAAAVNAPDATSTCTQTGTIHTSDGQYTIQANEWNSSAPQCVTYDTGTAWSLSTANFSLPTNGAPATYPSIFKGCHWGDCTPGSGLPIQVSNLATATSSWSTTQVASGAYDVAYDIWFNSTPTTPGQPDGTEVMIWLNSRGGVQPFGSRTGTSTAAGHNWDVWTGQQTSWKIISFVSNPGVTSVTNLDIKALISDAVSRGSLNPAHWLLDAEAGFEVWQGGQGLATTSFSFSATASSGGGGGTDTQAPSTPANLAVTGTTSSSASLSWTGSTDNVGVTGYDVMRNGTRVATATGTSFTDTGLTPSTQFTYTVRARDAAGNLSAPSTSVTATTAGTGGGGAGCTATQHIDNQWGTGFTATITVTNSGTAPIAGWTVGWTWPGNQSVANMWNATSHPSGQNQTATNMNYNGSVSPGQSTAFGFQANGAAASPTLTCTAS